VRQLATFLQKVPWVVGVARFIWRLKQPKFSAGVVGVMFNEAGQVLLVEHVFHPYAPWGLPGGWVDRDENPDEAVIRELREELELDAQIGPLLLAEVDFGNHLDLAYLCYARGEVGELSKELLDYGWYGADTLPRLHRFHYVAIQSALKFRQTYSSSMPL
jgi:ADP-ribose pyrophosphatase YjhB (NUDIX family)